MENTKKLISKSETKKIAELARLDLGENEIEDYSKQISSVLEYVGELSLVETKNISATSQVTGLSNVTREDVVSSSLESEDLVALAPEKENGLIKVKGVF
jgi:aspartyl-tRNA(Asn)/glutamyl-tRNA(Gln) amidotransferase subunit C